MRSRADSSSKHELTWSEREGESVGMERRSRRKSVGDRSSRRKRGREGGESIWQPSIPIDIVDPVIDGGCTESLKRWIEVLTPWTWLAKFRCLECSLTNALQRDSMPWHAYLHYFLTALYLPLHDYCSGPFSWTIWVKGPRWHTPWSFPRHDPVVQRCYRTSILFKVRLRAWNSLMITRIIYVLVWIINSSELIIRAWLHIATTSARALKMRRWKIIIAASPTNQTNFNKHDPSIARNQSSSRFKRRSIRINLRAGSKVGR